MTKQPLITLSDWLARTYGASAPTLETARRWARLKLIVPCPEKHGRTYYVVPSAVYAAKESQHAA